MRILVTGATGFIGSHAAVALQDAGHAVRALVRDPAKLERVFAAHGRKAPEPLVGDIADPDSVGRAIGGCEAVVHTAAVVTMRAHRAAEVLATNARGVENVVGGAARRGVGRIVYMSSVGALFEPGGPVVTEESPVMPGSSAYARSKSDAERTVRRLQEEGAAVRTLYPAAVVGPDDPGLSESNHALRTFVKDSVLLTSGGYQPIDVRDLAAMTLRLVERAECHPRYVAAGPMLTWKEIADTLDSITGARVRRIPMPSAILRAAGRVGDVIKRVWDFDYPLTREAMDFATRWPGADGSRALRELELELRPATECFADTLRWMHRAGHVEAAPLGRLVA